MTKYKVFREVVIGEDELEMGTTVLTYVGEYDTQSDTAARRNGANDIDKPGWYVSVPDGNFRREEFEEEAPQPRLVAKKSTAPPARKRSKAAASA